MTTAPQKIGHAATDYDVDTVRRDFPVLERTVHGKPLAYLDNAATVQRPIAVIDAVADFYRRTNANIHRGVHALSVEATDLFENTRNRMRRFINAADTREIIFTRGATEALNLVARCYGRANLREGDEIILSNLEHHSNIVPWQMIREETGAVIRVAPINDAGELLIDEYEKLLSDRTRIVAIQHVSNALGTVNPIRRITELAHERGAVVVVDGAQAAPHLRIDVEELGVDFYAISAHKMYGPTGVGVLYGRRELLEAMPPWLGGGDMIRSVTFEKTTYNDPPNKFEAGTPNIAGVIGLGAAVEYLESLGLDNIARHEHELLEYATERVGAVDGVRLFGTARNKAAVVSFNFADVHPHDVGTILDAEGVAIRTGHHCAQPLMERFGVAATARASFGLYNTTDEVDRLADALAKVAEVFG